MSHPRAQSARGSGSRLPRCRVALLLFLSGALLAAPAVAGGLQPSFTHLDLTDGLSQLSIRAIVQDPTGFMWFATQDGLDRFDGSTFRVFRNDPEDPTSISDNNILSLLVDHTGALWVGTLDHGLDRFDPVTESFTRYRNDPGDPTSLSHDRISALCEDASGRLWVGTAGGGLNRFDPATGSFIRFRHDPADPASLPDDNVLVVFSDQAGRLVVATAGGVRFLGADGASFVTSLPGVQLSSSAAGAVVTALIQDRAGRIWVGTFGGLHRFDPRTGEVVSFRHDPHDPSSLADDQIVALLEDSAGRIWIGTGNAGLDVLDPETGAIVHAPSDYADPRSLSRNLVLSLFEDRAGIVWVGVDGGGINVFDPQRAAFAFYTHHPTDPDSLSATMVRAIWEDDDGSLWVGTAGGGLDHLDRDTGRITHHLPEPGRSSSLSDPNVYTIMRDSAGTLWVGTWGGGLDRMDASSGVFTHFRPSADDPTSLSSTFVRSLAEDAGGALWVGTVFGLNRMDRASGTFTRFFHDPDDPASLSNDNVWTVQVDPTGTLWVGTDSGLDRYDPATKSFTHLGHDPARRDTLSSNRVMSVWRDGPDTLWVATTIGLNRVDLPSGTVTRFRESDGLPNDMLYAVLGDGRGNLWLSSNKGIIRVTPGPDGAIPRNAIRSWDVRDGLQSNEFNGGAYYRGRSGELFFGGVNGVTAFFPDRVQERTAAPPVVLTGFRKLGEPVSFGRALHYVDEIDLRHDENFFSFEFSALSYQAPGKIRLAYRLEGLDRAWIPAGARRFASYTSVPPGRYTFRVRAAAPGGAWSEGGASVRVVVRPPWWRTTWAYAGYLAALLAVALASGRAHQAVIVAQERKRAQLREAELRAQAAEAQARAVEAENRRKSDELEEARTLQLSMLPSRLPQLPGLDIAVHMTTATEVGGDYYDFAVAPDGTLAVALGDATGHGLQAGTMVSVMKGLFAGASLADGVGAFLDHASAVFRELRVGHLYMALTALTLRGGRLAVASAGMPPLYVFHPATGEVEEVLFTGTPLGVAVDCTYPVRELDLAPGETVLLLSDGLPETLDAGERPFDYTRVREHFLEVARRSPEEIVESLVAAGNAWRGDTPLRDDVTLVVIRRQ